MAAQCESRRIELISAINDLAATIEQSLAIADPWSIGALIDRMAAAAEQAMRQLAVSGARSVQMHEAWTRLAELESVQRFDPPHRPEGSRHMLDIRDVAERVTARCGIYADDIMLIARIRAARTPIPACPCCGSSDA